MKKLTIAMTCCGLLAMSAGVAAAASPEYCDGVARHYADKYSRPANNAVGGAVAGAVGGAFLGAIFGGRHAVGRGAAIGAGAGTVAGLAHGSRRWQDIYDQTFDDCMSQPVRYEREEGPPPPPPPPSGPPKTYKSVKPSGASGGPKSTGAGFRGKGGPGLHCLGWT